MLNSIIFQSGEPVRFWMHIVFFIDLVIAYDCRFIDWTMTHNSLIYMIIFERINCKYSDQERLFFNRIFSQNQYTTFSKPMWHFFWNQYKTLKNQCDNLNLNVTMAHGPCLTQSLFLYFLIRHYSVSAIFDLEYY